jgi:hypothetical protein
VTEREFRQQIVGPKGLATILGWLHAGFRPAQTAHGWRTPVTGELGAGWPDLTLVRVRDRRLLFVELKAETGEVSPAQHAVHATLRGAGLDVVVWRPSDWATGEIEGRLR